MIKITYKTNEHFLNCNGFNLKPKELRNLFRIFFEFQIYVYASYIDDNSLKQKEIIQKELDFCYSDLVTELANIGMVEITYKGKPSNFLECDSSKLNPKKLRTLHRLLNWINVRGYVFNDSIKFNSGYFPINWSKKDDIKDKSKKYSPEWKNNWWKLCNIKPNVKDYSQEEKKYFKKY